LVVRERVRRELRERRGGSEGWEGEGEVDGPGTVDYVGYGGLEEGWRSRVGLERLAGRDVTSAIRGLERGSWREER
jgi:hypothetical protein